jgi:hypothetical protein
LWTAIEQDAQQQGDPQQDLSLRFLERQSTMEAERRQQLPSQVQRPSYMTSTQAQQKHFTSEAS